MTPANYLSACLIATLLAVAIYIVRDAIRHRRLRRLAAAAGMHFCPGDRFKLAAEVARRFPVIGAADPKVSDLLYCHRDHCDCYVFRFEYTVGVIGPKLRRRAIVGFVEPHGSRGGEWSPLAIAAESRGGGVVAQYQQLIDQLGRSPEDPAGKSQQE